jgi:hypothetical protein
MIYQTQTFIGNPAIVTPVHGGVDMPDVLKPPDVSRNEIGQRLYQVTKEKSAEAACEKVRAHLGPRWSELDRSEVESLKRILGQAWTCVDGKTWDRIEFHNLSYDDVRKILNTSRWSGDDLAARQRCSDEALRILCRGISPPPSLRPGTPSSAAPEGA